MQTLQEFIILRLMAENCQTFGNAAVGKDGLLQLLEQLKITYLVALHKDNGNFR